MRGRASVESEGLETGDHKLQEGLVADLVRVQGEVAGVEMGQNKAGEVSEMGSWQC